MHNFMVKYFSILIIIGLPLALFSTVLFWIDPSYKTSEFVTLLFTVIVFLSTFIIKEKLSYFFKFTLNHKFIFSILLFLSLVIIGLYQNNKFENNYYFWIISSLIILYFIYYIIVSYQNFYQKIFKKKYDENINNIKETFLQEEEYFQLKKFNFKLEKIKVWKNIIMIFSTYHKKESLNLAKKNKIMEKIEYESKQDKPSFFDILTLKHYIEVFNTFHTSIVSIERNNKKITFTKEKELLSNLIFKFKIMHYNTSFFITYKLLISTLQYLITFIWSMLYLKIIADIFFNFKNIGSIEYGDILMFVGGITLLYLTIPISYIYFTHLKLKNLKIWTETHHIAPLVFFKNLFYYSSTFFVSLLLIIFSITLLSHSGVEYNYAFHFIITLILPMIELKDIPALLSNSFGDDIVFGIFMIKIFFLIFIFSIGILLIQHIIELYIQEYDAHKFNQYSIPPEFTKFFSYLVLSIFALILFYGTLFINYPNLSHEYNECKPYLQDNKNFYTKEYCKKEINKDLNKTEPYIINDCREFNNISNSKENPLSSTHCYILMKDFVNNKDSNNSISNPIGKSSSPSRELTDYLPLSIFLALFGTLIMLATKNLLENYFTGLSLKIDPPYDEGERIKLDDGEMLAVESIGFRATTFYGIESNTQLVIPHQKITQATITNYTQPTLDYRKKITIYIPDTKYGKSIPREAEKILLLAAFISTGVKKPRISKEVESIIKDDLKQYIQNIKDYKNKNIADKNKDLSSLKHLKTLEENESKLIEKIWEKLANEKNKTQENLDKEKKDLFLYGIFKIVKDIETYNSNQNPLIDLNIIKKLVISIYSVLYEYKSQNKLRYHIDEYLVKRKFKVFDDFKNEDKQRKKDELNKISNYLVNINYYYFALAKQLWQLKDKDDSTQKKKDFDHTSLELLDVPRVTSAHKRDIEGAFWEVTLLVTVELSEQSDEIIQHINMYVDELWEIFDLPYRCNVEENSK